MKVGADGWLEEIASGFPPIARIPSPRTQLLDGATGNRPLGIVWHWTAGVKQSPGFARALAEEIRTWDKTKDRPASWHVLIGKDGAIYQSVPFSTGSWHVGRPGRIGGQLFANINRATVGVELLNAGLLEKVDEKFYAAGNNHGPEDEVAADRAVAVANEWYDAFPEAQEMAATRLLQALVIRFAWNRDVCAYGHRDFDSPRKLDPGPLWQDTVLPRVLDRIFGPT